MHHDEPEKMDIKKSSRHIRFKNRQNASTAFEVRVVVPVGPRRGRSVFHLRAGYRAGSSGGAASCTLVVLIFQGKVFWKTPSSLWI